MNVHILGGVKLTILDPSIKSKSSHKFQKILEIKTFSILFTIGDVFSAAAVTFTQEEIKPCGLGSRIRDVEAESYI